jgi:hypothetical protein
MSNTVKSKNISKDRLNLWIEKYMCYVKLVEASPKGSERLPYIKEMFDFMTADLWWIDLPGNSIQRFIKIIKRKLLEFKEDTVTDQYYNEYFRNVEEKLGFMKYCGSTTGKGYRCATSIIKGKKNNYCKMHEKVLERKSLRISEFIGSSDVSMLIAQYV